MTGDNETNFSHKLLLTNRQVANLRKAFANYLSSDIKLSKTQLSKMIQSERFLGRLLGPLLKTVLLLIKNTIKPLAKSVLIPLGLTAAPSTADAVIHKEQKGGFLSMLLGTLRASLLGKILAGKGIIRAGEGEIATRQVRGIVRAVYENNKKTAKWIFNAASSFN